MMGSIYRAIGKRWGWRRGMVAAGGVMLGLGWGLAAPGLAATQIQLQFEGESVTIPLDELEAFANAGTLPSAFDNLPPSERERVKVEQVKLREALAEVIDLDAGERLTLDSLSEQGRELFELVIPDLTDATLAEISDGLAALGNGKSILDFLHSFPGETVTSTHFVDTLVAQAPIEPEPESPKPDPADAVVAEKLEVLWYGHGENSFYNTQIEALAASAPGYDPWGDGSLDWNLTFWDLGDPVPDFSAFDVLAIGSAFRMPHRQIHFDAARLFENKDAIEAARGSRTFLSGQDADIHFMLTHGFEADGPFGFLVNAVNWAGSGTGLGILALTDGRVSGGAVAEGRLGSRWWLHEDSFLRDELDGYVSYFNTNSVLPPDSTELFPINEGLTAAGLSDPGTNVHFASHAGFKKNIPGFRPINDTGRFPDFAVTIVTEGEASGGTGGSRKVPEPALELGLFVLGSFGLLVLKCRR